MDPRQDRERALLRTRVALDGLSVGAALAHGLERYPGPVMGAIRRRATPKQPWPWPGDALLAIGLLVHLEGSGGVDPDALAQALAERYLRDIDASFDDMTHWVLAAIASGLPWKQAAASALDGPSPMGHGAALRAGLVGARFADDLDAAVAGARVVAEVVDARPEAAAEAIAVAAAAALAVPMGDGRATPDGVALLRGAAERVPPGPTRQGLQRARAALAEGDPWPHGPGGSDGPGPAAGAEEPVVLGLLAAASKLGHFPEAVWRAAENETDRVTSCAVAGAIAALGAPDGSIPAEWRLARDPIRR